MAVPDYQTFMRPLLLLAADGAEHGINEAIGNLADEFRLPEEDRSQLLPSGLGTVLANRVSWAKTYLMKAGALEKTRRAHFRITDRGRDLLREYPEGVNSQTLRKFPEFMAFQQPSDDVPPEKRGAVEAPRSRETSPETPEEAIQRAENEITLALQENLLTRIHELSPTFSNDLLSI
jgi:restriction system protein